MKRKLIASLICGVLLTSTASVSAMTAETELKLETIAYFEPIYDQFITYRLKVDYESIMMSLSKLKNISSK